MPSPSPSHFRSSPVAMAFFFFIVVPLFVLTVGDKEELHHGRETFEQKHMNMGKHNVEMDHKAILGSEKSAHEFDELPTEESKKRLRVLAKRMDRDKDGFVTMEELADWVKNSLMTLDQEETKERFDEIDEDKDGVITWTEYTQEAFGVSDSGDEPQKLLTDPDDMKLFEEDRRYFAAADLDKDSKLTLEEFGAFQNPEHSEHMHQTLIEARRFLNMNKDGMIELGEFMGDMAHEQPQSEWYQTEKTRFREEYDKDGDGFLNADELRAWLIPDLSQTAKQEAEHLIENADSDKDGRLSIDEVVEAYKTFVGSEATNYGEHLMSIRHDEL
uniref:Reticulocalbin-3 n=1 Tax=Globodera pallida TaxID=36090 RepID=A0A183BU04_GLOPA